MGQYDKILVVGATGYIGKFVATASAKLGHPTFALIRPTTLADPAKAGSLAALKSAGVKFLPGELEDQASLVEAVKQVDVVISTVGGAQLHDQLNLIKAIKEVGTIKRFLPSEFGNDATREKVLPPLQGIFDLKIAIQNATKEAGIPYPLVSSNSFAGYFVANLSQADVYSPPKDKAIVYGHAKAYFVEEEDIGVYTIKAALDPRAENKTLFLRPAHNLLSHPELVELWEKKSGAHLHKTQLEDEDLLKKVEEVPFPNNIILAIYYSLYIKGHQSNFEVPHDAVEATHLYPDVEYTTVDKYFDRFLTSTTATAE
eukprot:TRINITY_DN92_c0_g1_i1.p1 TRINITY_DN92_c0_g1~~TRINITY_DN92_c0_g1_i1.p1  ORF type:complete len:314 (+),score=59.35 TRINITY_DN92_c0_g1_i1:140-1081(+)